MKNAIFSPTSLVLVAGNTQSLIRFCHGHLDSRDETESATAHQSELTTPCKPLSYINLQVRTSFCVDPEHFPVRSDVLSAKLLRNVWSSSQPDKVYSMSVTVPKWASRELSERLPQIRAEGESLRVDFKQDFPDQSHRLAKEIAAMASSGGGQIFVGINDNGDLCGLNVSTGDERDDIAERAHSIARTVKPVPTITFHFAVESEKTVLVIDVLRQDYPVFYYDSRPYVRDKRRARPAEPEEVVEMVWAHPSSEHKRAMERLTLQQMQQLVDRSRE
jgi:hypothetical protein